MAYKQQTQAALERLDQSLARLYTMVKRGETENALRFMTEGDLKDRYEDLQSMINISTSDDLGAGGTSQTRTL